MEPKKKVKKVSVENEVITNLTPIIESPQPPELYIQLRVDNPYHEYQTHIESEAENSQNQIESTPSTSVVSAITLFEINNLMFGKNCFPD